jgi:small-conductance mechanosensitive channel
MHGINFMKQKIFRALLLLTLVFAPSAVLHNAASAEEPAGLATTSETGNAPVPLGMADVLRFPTRLAERDSVLENELAALPDLSAVKQRFFALRSSVEGLTQEFETLKSTAGYSYELASEFKARVDAKAKLVEEGIELLSEEIGNLEGWRKEWMGERTRLKELRDSIPQDVPRGTVEPTLARAQKSIDTALQLISKRLELVLGVQEEASDIQAKVDDLDAAVSAMVAATRTDLFRKSAPSVFSKAFYAQFGQKTRQDLQKGVNAVSWPSKQFVELHGWKILVQALIILVIGIGIVRHRNALEANEQWRFLARRPLSVGWLVSMALILPFYDAVVGWWAVVVSAFGAICTARLFGAFTSEVTKRSGIYALAGVWILFPAFRLINLPPPLFRLYVIIIGGTGFLICLRLTLASFRRRESYLKTLALCAASLILLIVLISELGGYSSLAAHVLESSIETVFLILLAWMFMFLVRGFLQLTLHTSALEKIPRLRTNETTVVNRLMLLIGMVVVFLVLAGFLVVWRVYVSPLEALQGLLSLGLSVGSWRITSGTILIAAAILYGSFLASWVLQGLLLEQVFPKRRVQRGVQLALSRLVHYALVTVGFLFALGALGVNFRNITIIGGALGVGIGFGLQSIVNNFVSGLILLFERPIKVGDWVQMADQWGEISKIGLRATVVQTFDRSEIVVPNADLVSNQVTNWTLTDRYMRIRVNVGVAYGSDVPLVIQTLKEVALDNPMVVSDPAPQILFMAFGESSLDFELRIWVNEIGNFVEVRSQLNQEIDRSFREAGIEIAFPQRDLHLRSVDELAASALSRPGSQASRSRESQESEDN